MSVALLSKQISGKFWFLLGTLSILLVTNLAYSPIINAAPVTDAAKRAACESIEATGQGSNCDGTAQTGVSSLLAKAINVLSWIVGIISVIMIIVGGLKFILSSGDANGISSAKKTVIYALVGLAIAGLAQVLTAFVITNVK